MSGIRHLTQETGRWRRDEAGVLALDQGRSMVSVDFGEGEKLGWELWSIGPDDVERLAVYPGDQDWTIVNRHLGRTVGILTGEPWKVIPVPPGIAQAPIEAVPTDPTEVLDPPRKGQKGKGIKYGHK